MCGSCGNGSCSGGCNRIIAASCSSNCSTGCGSHSGSSHRGGGCVTSVAILKNSVSERNCCSSEDAHVYAYNVSSINIPANGFVTFDHFGDNNSILLPGNGTLDLTQFRILHAGTYQYNFFVKGVATSGSTFGTHPLVFELFANGVQVLGSQYTSQDKDISQSALNHYVVGKGIFTVPANAIIQLHNISGASNDVVTLIAFPTGGLGSTLAVNAALRIVRIC